MGRDTVKKKDDNPKSRAGTAIAATVLGFFIGAIGSLLIRAFRR